MVVKPVGDLFIKLLLMAAIPLVFFNLIAGITSLSDIRILGRLGLRTLTYYIATTSVALCLGLFMAHFMQPGRGMQLSEQVDPSLLGGAIATVGGVVFDGSLRTQLDQLRVSLMRGH